MDYNKYNDILITANSLEFTFISKGPNGDLRKLIQFRAFQDDGKIYNLAFGTIKNNGRVDYEEVSNNGDRNKILATVGFAAFVFSDSYPDKHIFLKGDTPVKTRLYQIAICVAYEQISEKFEIRGLKIVGRALTENFFEKGTNYNAFIFIRKEIAKKN